MPAPLRSRVHVNGTTRLNTQSIHPLRILLVEDNADLREAVGLLIEAPGRDVVLCGTGEEALNAVAGGRFDIVFTDLRLPGVSGVDLARRLLDDDPLQWVVFCSGEYLPPELDALGFHVRRLSKPFELTQVEALLDEARAGPR